MTCSSCGEAGNEPATIRYPDMLPDEELCSNCEPLPPIDHTWSNYSCPYCHSQELNSETLDYDKDTISVEMSCENKHQWSAHFTLTSAMPKYSNSYVSIIEASPYGIHLTYEDGCFLLEALETLNVHEHLQARLQTFIDQFYSEART